MLFPLALLSLAVSPVAVSTMAGSPAPRYALLVFPPLDGVESAYPAAFTLDGHIVGSASPKPFHPQSVAVMTSGEALTPLPSEFRAFNAALGAAGDDLVVGTMSLAPAVWIHSEGSLLTPIPGYFGGAAWDVNNAGMIVGTHTNDLVGFDFPVYWSSSGATAMELPTIDSASGAALSVNASGAIAGALTVEGSMRPVRWDTVDRAPTVLPLVAQALGGEARAINDKGDVAGRSSFADFTSRAFLHRRGESEAIDLGTLGGFASEARALNNAGEVVGVSGTPGSVAGFLWTGGVLHDLNSLVIHKNEPAAHIVAAVDITDDGRIAAEVVIGAGLDGPRRIALLTPCVPADLDCDGAVGGSDLAVLLGAWGACANCPADIDGDGAVGAADLAVLLGAWS